MSLVLSIITFKGHGGEGRLRKSPPRRYKTVLDNGCLMKHIVNKNTNAKTQHKTLYKLETEKGQHSRNSKISWATEARWSPSMQVSAYGTPCKSLVSMETPKVLLGRKAGTVGELRGKY